MAQDDDLSLSLLDIADAARTNLARGVLGYLKHELSQPLGAILLTTEACAMGLRAGRVDVDQIITDLQDINRLADNASKLGFSLLRIMNMAVTEFGTDDGLVTQGIDSIEA